MSYEDYKKSAQFLTKQIDDELLLIPLHEDSARLSKTFLAKGIGPLIWEIFDDSQDIDHMAKEITKNFDVDYETAKDDITQYLQQLIEIGALVKRSN